MGQRNNSKRNATLDDHKTRAAGRLQNKPGIDAIRSWAGSGKDRTAAGGAFGKQGKANRAVGARGTGGGTGLEGDSLDVSRSSRPSRKRT